MSEGSGEYDETLLKCITTNNLPKLEEYLKVHQNVGSRHAIKLMLKIISMAKAPRRKFFSTSVQYHYSKTENDLWLSSAGLCTTVTVKKPEE